MEVSDCHQAIQATLNSNSDLSGDVVLVGESYGGFIAAILAAKYPAWYRVTILKNPLVDLSAMADQNQLLFWLLGGKNFTEKSVPDSDMLNEALLR
jgi:pimeloyl-ACP methyl ester carboxylesterase